MMPSHVLRGSCGRCGSCGEAMKDETQGEYEFAAVRVLCRASPFFVHGWSGVDDVDHFRVSFDSEPRRGFAVAAFTRVEDATACMFELAGWRNSHIVTRHDGTKAAMKILKKHGGRRPT